jgi:plastocyanin
LKKLTMLLCALGMLVLSAGLVACGDDDEDSASTDGAATTTEASADATTVDVTGTEYAFELSATPTAETQEVTYTNDGEEAHDLIFVKLAEGVTLDEAFEAQGREGTTEEEIGVTFAQPGQSGKPIEVKKPLDAGTYAMVCTLETKDGELHYDLGMQEEFTIE